MNKEVNQEERTPRTVGDVKEMLTKHSNGEIQRTIQNCITILQNDRVLADAIRLNLLSERILPTVCASASLLARPIGRIFCPVTAQETAALSLSQWMRNWLKSTFWTTRKNPVPISTSSGQKL